MSLMEKEKQESKKYLLETENIIYNNNEQMIVKLTSDNVARVEAMIQTDSDYKDSNDINKMIVIDRKGRIKYIGSSYFWLSQLKELLNEHIDVSISGFNYEQVIKNLIIAIDNENSTHLNSDNIGREVVKNKLLKISKKELVEYLKNPNGCYELVNLIQSPIEIGEKNHLSFGTKFCHYTCQYLFKGSEIEDNFSIYDNVLKNALPLYVKRYLGIDIDYKEYENDYCKYMKYIDKVRKEASILYKNDISRNGFDHLLWYYHKGRN